MAQLAEVPKVRLSGGLEICRLLNGMWQVSGSHGPVDPRKAVTAMQDYVNAGLTTFDMADIYGPAEEIFGNFYSQVVEKAIQRSMSRMQVERLDCVQLNWWDYADKRYLDALGHLSDLQQDGVIRELSLTNFDTERLEEITSKGVRISSNQVQYSLIDRRPAAKMEKFCLANGIQLLTYGTLGGGLITERFLGREEPKGRRQLVTVSLSKYKDMVDEWGSWALFQELLSTLDAVARRRGCSIANVATKYVLDQPAVAGVIVGCRLGVEGAQHIQDNLRCCGVQLAAEDLRAIESVLERANDLALTIGDCGAELRK